MKLTNFKTLEPLSLTFDAIFRFLVQFTVTYMYYDIDKFLACWIKGKRCIRTLIHIRDYIGPINLVDNGGSALVFDKL